MVQKRQLAEEVYDVSPKHLKLEHSCDLVPSLHITKENASLKSDKDDACFFKPIIEVDYGFISGKFTDLPVCTTKDFGFSHPDRLSTSSWAHSTSEEDVKPLKEVPIGPEYQADIPECHGYGGYDEYENKFLGSCVITMPEEPTIHDNDAVGRGKTDCYCENLGSHECVQQHIKEAREILKTRIGHQRFADLGFDNMGEVVAEKWSEKDEHLFHEIIYSNPVSFAKYFWEHLAAEFPSRTNQEIVRYYFNVFMLRRRAEQNRCDSMNVDSDDDEWHGNDTSEEEEDEEIHKFDSYEHGNGIENHSLSESQPRKLHNSSSFDSISQPSSEKTMVDESGDGGLDFQNESCTSSDGSKSWGNHELIFEPSDSRVWDVGYFSCSRTKNDFLPTGSMIEEVFGVESWNFEVTDDNKSSD